MSPSISRNRFRLDLVSPCVFVLVRTQVIITDTHVKVKAGGAWLEGMWHHIAEVVNEDEDEGEIESEGVFEFR